MAATLGAIMTALQVRLATISGLQAFDYAPDDPVIPCAFPLVPAIPDYRATMARAKYILPMRVVVLTGAQLDRVGQHRLAEYASQTGASSIRAAIEADTTLGGIADDTIVDSFNPDGLVDVGLVGYYGGVFHCRVAINGT